MLVDARAVRRGAQFGAAAALSLVLVGMDRGVGDAVCAIAAPCGRRRCGRAARPGERATAASPVSGRGRPGVSLALRGLRSAAARGDGVRDAGDRVACASIPEVLGDAGVLLDPTDEGAWTEAIVERRERRARRERDCARLACAGPPSSRGSGPPASRSTCIGEPSRDDRRRTRLQRRIDRPRRLGHHRHLERPPLSRGLPARGRGAAGRQRRRSCSWTTARPTGRSSSCASAFRACGSFALDENRGFAGGNNAGAREARGRVSGVPQQRHRGRIRAGSRRCCDGHRREAGFALATSRIVYMHDPGVIDSAGDGLFGGVARSSGTTARASRRPRRRSRCSASAARPA